MIQKKLSSQSLSLSPWQIGDDVNRPTKICGDPTDTSPSICSLVVQYNLTTVCIWRPGVSGLIKIMDNHLCVEFLSYDLCSSMLSLKVLFIL